MPVQQSCFKFTAKHRLRQSVEFDQVFNKNEARHSTSSLLFLAKPNQQGFNRLGMVIGKKNIPLAVDRNRIKRQIRESFRQFSTDNKTGVDVVVLARPGARTNKKLFDLLQEGFAAVLNQGGQT